MFAAAPGTDPIGARDAAMLALLYGAGLQRSEAVALQLADCDQASGAITVRHDERQVYATNGGRKRSMPGSRAAATGRAPCCARSGAGAIQTKAMTDQAVMLRGAHHRQAGRRRAGDPERSAPDVLDRAGEAATRRPDEGQARRGIGTRDNRPVPRALIRSR